MDIMNQLDFLNRCYLPNRHRHPEGFTFSHNCIHGLDKKRRGYALIKGDFISMYCHRCGMNTNLSKYLESYDPTLYEEYKIAERNEYFEKARTGTIREKLSIPSHIIDPTFDLKLFKFNDKYFHPAKLNRQCVDYCRLRHIPDEKLETLYYNSHPTIHFGNSLVFPFNKGEYNYGFQTRRLDIKRFYNFSKNDSFKVYNIFNVDLDKDVYIFESIIDSFHKTNSIAALGTSLSVQVLKLVKNRVFVLDNDNAGMKRAMEYAQAGERVMLYPTNIKAKDCNELAMKCGMNNKSIEDMILNNTFKGFGAEAKLKLRMRGKK